VVGTVHEGCSEQCGDDAIPARRRIQKGCRVPDTGEEEVVEEGNHRAAEVRIPRIQSHEGADEEEEVVHRDRVVPAWHGAVRREDAEKRSDLGPIGILAVHPQLERFRDRLGLPQRLLLHFGIYYLHQGLPDCVRVLLYLRLCPVRIQFWSPLWVSRLFHAVLLL
jgi:hypothetical protein